jgi:hypothetical protein
MEIIFVLRTFSVGKSIENNIFLLPTYLPIDKKLPMKESSMEHFLVSDFVGKLITNRIIVQISTKKSIGKCKDCGSVINNNRGLKLCCIMWLRSTS